MQLICKLIKQQREQKKISLEKLSSGLCHFTYLANDIEKKGNVADKFLIDSLLQRLGISVDFFEHFVSLEDINIQNIRIEIFENLKLKNYEKIDELFDNFQEYKLDNIHQQFIEYTKAKVMQMQAQPIELIINQYLVAIKLTLLDFDNNNINELLLSSVESHMIFEYSMLIEQVNTADGLELYLQLYRYFNKTDIEIGLIFPQIIYNICKIWLDDKKYVAILNLCDIGIEYLRESDNLYYLTKLLEIKLSVLNLKEYKNKNKIEYEKIKKWYDVLTQFFNDYKVNPNSKHVIYTQYFLWKNYDAIGDVIKNRRKMFGLSQSQLANGICDVRTLSRIENGHVKPHVFKTELILQKLNLSGQFYADSIVTDDYDTFLLARQLNGHTSQNRFDLILEEIENLSKILDLDNKKNLQYLEHKKIIVDIDWKTRKDNILNQLIYILEITLPKKALFSNNKLYLTKKEIILINNIVLCYSSLNKIDANKANLNIAKGKLDWLNLIENYINNNESQYNLTHFNSYSFSCLNIASMYGNDGNFEKSNYIAKKLLHDIFKVDCYHEICNTLYDFVWNAQENNEVVPVNILDSINVLIEIQRRLVLKGLLENLDLN